MAAGCCVQSLCNACGTRYRKRIQALSLDARQHADLQEDQRIADFDPQEDRQPATNSDTQPKRKPVASSTNNTSKNKEEEDQQLRPKKKNSFPGPVRAAELAALPVVRAVAAPPVCATVRRRRIESVGAVPTAVAAREAGGTSSASGSRSILPTRPTPRM
jgi:hypothetical protein